MEQLEHWLADTAGIPLFHDVHSDVVGAPDGGGLDSALAMCQSMVNLLTRRAVDSGWARMQFDAGMSRQGRDGPAFRILPIRVEDCDLPEFLQTARWFDISEGGLTVELATKILLSLYSVGAGALDGKSRDVYFIRSWKDDENRLENLVSVAAKRLGFRLTYSSYKKRDLKKDRPVTSIESFAITWGNSVRALEDCRQMAAPENHYIIHYEDLVHNPEETMGGIAKFLGIEMLPGLLEPPKGFGLVPWGGNPESGIRRTGVIYQDATQKWRRDLEADEIARLEGLLSKEMELAGYWPSDPPKKYPLSAANVYLRINLSRFLNLGL